MPLQANKTHTHFTRNVAIKSAEHNGLDPDDLHFYVADPGTGKRMWGWCPLDEAELAAAAEDPSQTALVEVLADAEPTAPAADAADDEELSVEAILARNAERTAAAAGKPALEAVSEPDPVPVDPGPDSKPIANAMANAIDLP